MITPLFCTSVENGVKNHLWASTAPAAKAGDDQEGDRGDKGDQSLGTVVSGTYYEPVGVTGKDSALARDEELRVKLWEWVEKELEGEVRE